MLDAREVLEKYHRADRCPRVVLDLGQRVADDAVEVGEPQLGAVRQVRQLEGAGDDPGDVRQVLENLGVGPADVARLRRQAERLWDQATAAETAWDRVRLAFEFFTPEGRLNDRGRAEAVVTAALPRLGGEAWAKTRRLLMRRESFTFLDQVGERLAGLGLAPDVLPALLDLEALRRQPRRMSAATRAWALARTVQLAKSCPDWPEQAVRVRATLRGAWRASSLVECVNSVARMQQARHRVMTQGLLDLKRLYWNLRRFRTGRRQRRTPYELLGLKLPEMSFGEFLKLSPDELREQLSAQDVAP